MTPGGEVTRLPGYLVESRHHEASTQGDAPEGHEHAKDGIFQGTEAVSKQASRRHLRTLKAA
jgi:hypothetical protein